MKYRVTLVGCHANTMVEFETNANSAIIPLAKLLNSACSDQCQPFIRVAVEDPKEEDGWLLLVDEDPEATVLD